MFLQKSQKFASLGIPLLKLFNWTDRLEGAMPMNTKYYMMMKGMSTKAQTDDGRMDGEPTVRALKFQKFSKSFIDSSKYCDTSLHFLHIQKCNQVDPTRKMEPLMGARENVNSRSMLSTTKIHQQC